MKKKDKQKKKENMPDFNFRQFTPEEDQVYEEAVRVYREAIAAGTKLKEAYEAFPVADAELRALIQADFLKIMIAERHFAKREDLQQVAADLGVPLDLVKEAYGRMLQEVGVTAANEFGKQFGPVTGTDD